MTSLTSPERNQVAPQPRSVNRLDNLPYDLRLMIWQATFGDELRVILANSTMELRKATPSNHDEDEDDAQRVIFISGTPVRLPTPEPPAEEFDVDIFPSEQSAVHLATTFFPREIKSDPSFMQNLFETKSTQAIMKSSKNIYFIQDLRLFAKAALEACARATRSQSGLSAMGFTTQTFPTIDLPLVFMEPGKEIESIAIEAWSNYKNLTEKDEIEFRRATQCLVTAVYDIPTLKTIYFVQPFEDSGNSILDKSRFKSFQLGEETTSSQAAGETKRRRVTKDCVEGYHTMSQTRKIFRETWEGYRKGTERPLPALKLVCWDK